MFQSICASFSKNNVCKKTQFCVKQHLNERIFQRQISARRKRLLLAALTACFLEMNVLVVEISRETDKKKEKKKPADLVSNRCHDKTNLHQARSTPQSLALTKQQ